MLASLSGDTEADEEAIDLFSEYYRPTDLTDFESLFCATMPTSTRDFMPESSTDPSPFVVRDDGPSGAVAAATGSSSGASPTQHRHNIAGQPVSIDDSSDEESSSDDERDGIHSPFKKSTARETGAGTGESRNTGGWQTITNVNGITVSEPAASDKVLYTRYSEISSLAAPRQRRAIDTGVGGGGLKVC